jgi:hypothetical protein
MNDNFNNEIVAMKRSYIVPVVEEVCFEGERFMKYTGPASVPGQAGAPRRQVEVF